MQLGVTAAAGERVDIAGDCAFTAPEGVACWMTRLQRRRSPRSGLIGDAADTSTFLAGGEATASACRVCSE